MPQMAPMSWMIIYLYFTMIMMMFIMKIYFNKTPLMKPLINKFFNKKEQIWKW